MIINIIFWSLILVGFILLAIGIACDWDEETTGAASGTFIIPALLVSIIIGPICISKNVSYTVDSKYIELSETITYLENKKTILENVKPIYNPEGEVVAFTSDVYLHYDNPQDYYRDVDCYNKEVKEFVITVKQKQIKRNNPWISWFVCPAYQKITTEELNKLSYTTGK